MPLTYGRPPPELMRELEEVARDATSLSDYLLTLNTLPDTFPAPQVMDICETLSKLPKGTAEGCRIPLEYARQRFPRVRREHVLNEDQIAASADEDDAPPLLRGMALDRMLRDLMGSVSTALDQYRLLASSEPDDTVGPEPVADMSDDPAIANAAALARGMEGDLHLASIEGERIANPESERADRLVRRMHDAEGLSRAGRAELGFTPTVISWFRGVVTKLKDYPVLIRGAGKAISTAADIARPFANVWHEFEKKSLDLIIDATAKVGAAFDQVADLLERNRAPGKFSGKAEEVDPEQLKAERQARDLLLAGMPVPPKIAALVRNLDLSGTESVRSHIPDLALLKTVEGIATLQMYRVDLKSIAALPVLTNLTELRLDADQASDLSALGGLTKLTSLRVQAHQVSDLSALGGLTNLTSLSVNANRVSDLSALAGLQRLARLTIVSSSVRDLSPLRALTELKILVILDSQVSDWRPVLHVPEVRR